MTGGIKTRITTALSGLFPAWSRMNPVYLASWWTSRRTVLDVLTFINMGHQQTTATLQQNVAELKNTDMEICLIFTFLWKQQATPLTFFRGINTHHNRNEPKHQHTHFTKHNGWISRKPLKNVSRPYFTRKKRNIFWSKKIKAIKITLFLWQLSPKFLL